MLDTRHPPALIAPDSFKGSLTAERVARAVARGIRAAGAEAVELPVADGGEGTMPVLVRALGGDIVTTRVSDPLGRPVQARFALLADSRTAVVEVAEAAGLALLGEHERNPLAATTYGVGELIVAAAERGAERVLVAAGGSATVDGGRGALEVLERHECRPPIVVLCDVRTPWEEAARIFGPQKGARPADLPLLAERLERLAEAAPKDPRGVPGSGAAGGLAGALWAWLDAELVEGARYVLDAIAFDRALAASWFVVTGEGRLDAQTLAGKVVCEVATRARQRGVTCHAICGQIALDEFGMRVLDLQGLATATNEGELTAAARELVHAEHPCLRDDEASCVE
ncbi:Glycerate 3-kinase [bacterium HR41]|nr:glycerate kinase [Thermoleophilum sp.]GBD46010.1 Glycerate 3-kinase [bacterium HR41]